MTKKVKKVEDQFVEVFVEGVSMSVEAEIKNDDKQLHKLDVDYQ